MDVIYNMAAFFALVAFLFRKELFLRSVVILACVFAIQYSINHHLNEVFWWSIACIAINAFQIVVTLVKRIPSKLPTQLNGIKELYFKRMSTADFLELMKLGTECRAESLTLINKGEDVRYLRMITQGTAYVYQGKDVLEMGPYHFLGEMSLFNNSAATTDVYINDPVQFIAWNYEAINHLKEKNHHLFSFLLEAIGTDILMKMMYKKNSDK